MFDNNSLDSSHCFVPVYRDTIYSFEGAIILKSAFMAMVEEVDKLLLASVLLHFSKTDAAQSFSSLKRFVERIFT